MSNSNSAHEFLFFLGTPVLQGGRNTPNPTRAQKKKLGCSLLELKCKKTPSTEESCQVMMFGKKTLGFSIDPQRE